MVARLALLATLTLLTALTAGCSDSAPDPVDTAPDPEPSVPQAVEKVPLKAMAPIRLGKGVGEPSIAAGPNGTVYVADPFMTIWRSTDGGRTYTQAASAGMDGGGDGDLAVDAAGTIHWLGLVGNVGPIPYQTSTDGGESFGPAVDISDGRGFDREWIDARPDGTIYTSWRDNDGLVVRVSHDAGATWGDKVVVQDDTLAGPVVFDPSSPRLYLPVVDSGQVAVHTSPNHGLNWTRASVAEVGPGLTNGGTNIFPVVSVDDAGIAYLVYSADSGEIPGPLTGPTTRWAIYLSVSTDHGESWSTPRIISDASKSSIMPWVAAGAGGRIVVVWYENTAGAPEGIPDLWNVRLWESVDANTTEPTSDTVLLNTDPIHIGLGCAGGRCTLGSDRSLLDMFEVAINTEGQPVVTWTATQIPFQYPASVLVGGPLEVDIYAGGLEEGTRLR